MKNQKSVIGYFIIGSAVIWGLVILGAALILRNTACFVKIQTILGGGAAIHIILWGALAGALKKQREQQEGK